MITLGLIVAGLFVLLSMKKSMEERVAFSIESKDGKESNSIWTLLTLFPLSFYKKRAKP